MTETNLVLPLMESNVPDSSPVFSDHVGGDAIKKKHVLTRISSEEEKHCSVRTQMRNRLEIIISLSADN